MPSSLGFPAHTSSSDIEKSSVRFVHTVSEAGRLLPSASRWNSIELDFNLVPQSLNAYDSIPSRFSKSFDYDLTITDRKHFKRFIFISVSIPLVILALVLLIHFVPQKHAHHVPSKNLTLAISQALTFFDAQKSGHYPGNSPVKFRGDSGLLDGSSSNPPVDLEGGFYDSGNNIKFSFTTAYTVTLLSWTVIEYHQKYADIGELGHVKDIIRWGSDYLLKLFVPPNATSDATIFSQVGSASNDTTIPNDINCWQRPEDMNYQRPVSRCDSTASDLAGEIVAALSAASLILKEDMEYSNGLVEAAAKLFELATMEDPKNQGTYTMDGDCGGDARKFYNSSDYEDELVWGGTWLFFATGNTSYLDYATSGTYNSAVINEKPFDKGVFYWNNKLTANVVLLTRLRYFHDLGYPYEDVFASSTNMTDSVICSYLSDQDFNKTRGGLILLKPNYGTPLQFAATAAFLSKLYSDYLDLLRRSGVKCESDGVSLNMLRSFSMSQVHYILGENPMKMSYMVGFGDHFPTQVHHRSASIPWDSQYYSCAEGDRWLNSIAANPNVLLGAMVAGPDQFDNFIDERGKPWFTEPTISSNAGLVAALIALHDPPRNSPDSKGTNLGIDQMGIFENIRLIPTAP